jgi:hypothetical protein
MPEWHAQHEWTRMGLWDLMPGDETLCRILCEPMLEALHEVRQLERIRAYRARAARKHSRKVR